MLSPAGVCSSTLRRAERAARTYGLDARDTIVDVALDLAAALSG